MLRYLIRRAIDQFERRYHYDSSYARQILDASPRAMVGLWGLSDMASYHRDIPDTVLYAAKIAAAVMADCGPCSQLAVTMAEQAKLDPVLLRAIVRGDLQAMGEEAALGYRFAQATLRREIEADELRAEIVQRWGQRALVSVAYAVSAAGVFPTLKYALGKGQACARTLRVAGADTPLHRPALA